MIGSYLVVAVRSLLRHRTHSLVTILGLSIGLSCFSLILTYVRYESSYDRQHRAADRIYRVLRETRDAEGNARFRPEVSGALAGAAEREIPEVLAAVRMFRYRVGFQHEDRLANLQFCLVDPGFFNTFDFPLVRGQPLGRLTGPASILLAERAAARMFGTDDPTGQTVAVSDDLLHEEYQVAGVIRDPPPNSSLRFDAVTTHVPSHFARLQWDDWLADSWRMTWVFVMLRKGATASEVEQQLQGLMDRHLGGEVSRRNAYTLQPLTRMHLYSSANYGIQTGSTVGHVYLLGAVAVLILAIACVNFTNLSVARSLERRREAGIRKVVGAQRVHIVAQFLVESVLTAILGLGVSIFLAEVLLPSFNELAQRRLEPDWTLLPYLALLSVAVGIGAGIYPSLFLSAFEPVRVMKSIPRTSTSGRRMRNGLTVVQIGISAFLVICSVVVHRQTEYLSSRDLGLRQGEVVNIWPFTRNQLLRQDPEHVKQRFLEFSGVQSASVVQGWGIHGPTASTVRGEGTENPVAMCYLGGDEDLVETYGFMLVSGRDVRRGAEDEFLVNETAARRLGWADPVGRRVEWVEQGRTGTVVGMVRDFHYKSFESAIAPILMGRWVEPSQLVLRIDPNRVQEALRFAEERWTELVPGIAFSYGFLGSHVERLFRGVRRTRRLATAASLVSLSLACMGLFGLVTYVVEVRTREAGIRKVLGATAGGLIALLSGDFFRLAAVATVLALPVAYVVSRSWLERFAYRIELEPMLFVLSGAGLVLLVGLTVAGVALRAALANPVDCLRQE